MLIGCCHCGDQSESSQSASGSASVSASASEGGSASASVGSDSASSDSAGYPTVPCSYCSTGVGPASFMMTWSLANNCPASGVFANMEVGCYDQAVGPHYGISSSAGFNTSFFRCFGFGSGCYWENNSTGEVTITRTGYGTCGSCANGPWIGIVVGQSGSGDYFMECFVYFYYNCEHPSSGPFDPVIGEVGYVMLHYRKTSPMPLNCMFEQELELVCSDGVDEFTDPPGTTEWGGLGPGCNYVTDYGTNFPTTIRIKPDTGGGTFP